MKLDDSNKLYFGATPVNRVYVGPNLAWQPSATAPWTPAAYAGSFSWFDAQDATTITGIGPNQPVTAWKDKIYSVPVTQYSTGPYYEPVGFNGRPGLNFLYGDHGLERAENACVPWVPAVGGGAFAVIKINIAGGQPRTIHGANYSGGAQFRVNDANQLQMIREFEAGLLNGTTVMAEGSYNIVSWQGNNTILQFYLNGVLDATLASDPGFHVGFMKSIGHNTSSRGEKLTSSLGEIVGCNANPDAATRQKFEGFLAHKWGLTSLLASGHPYKTTPPMTGP